MKLLIEDTLSFTKYAIIDNKELIYIDIIEKNDDARLDDIFIGEDDNYIDKSDKFDFSFDNEEDAFYFKMKYG